MHVSGRLASVLLLVATVVACGGAVPAPSTSGPTSLVPAAVAQRHVCGNLDMATCADAIARVTSQVPDSARSSVAVAAIRDPEAILRRGGDLVVLVSFAPDGFAGQDLWFSPPTWAVTLGGVGSAPTVEPWRETTLPVAFLTLLRQSGFAV
jgi:hypothetical protein